MKIHIVKRENMPFWKTCCLYLGAIVFAFALGAVVLMLFKVNPIAYYVEMITMGTIGSRFPYMTYMNYLKEFVPLVMTSVALSLAFKMRFWNIGGEGQFIMGGIAATVVAIKLGPHLPMGITLVLMCLAAMLTAGLYGMGVGALKVKFGTNETLLTLMLNYIALYLLTFFGDTKGEWNFFLNPEANQPKFLNFSDWVEFPSIAFGKFKLNICVVLAVVIGVLIFFYLKYTKQGYEINVVGDSIGTARYSGMKVNRIILRTVFLSAALIGLAAAFKVGTEGMLSIAVTGDVGWTGIVVAWLAQFNTLMIFVVSILISVLQFGSVAAAATFPQVDSSFADLLQGVILFSVLAAAFFIRYRVVLTRKKEEVTNG